MVFNVGVDTLTLGCVHRVLASRQPAASYRRRKSLRGPLERRWHRRLIGNGSDEFRAWQDPSRLVNSAHRYATTRKNRQRAGFQDVQQRRSGPWRCCPRASSRPSQLEAGWRQTRARTRSHLTSMSISIAAKRARQGIDADPGPPRGFIAVTVQTSVVQPADRDCVFIAHLSAESMGLGRRAAAHDAWLSPDELTVLPVAQANGGSSRSDAGAATHFTSRDLSIRPARGPQVLAPHGAR
jgi:hypothetical protein